MTSLTRLVAAAAVIAALFLAVGGISLAVAAGAGASAARRRTRRV